MRIEQCDRCRGIFLDHGELEHILSAEQHYYGSSHRGRADSPRPYRAHGGGHSGGGYGDSPRPYRGGHSDSPRPYRGHSGGHKDSPRPYRQGSHKRSFLGDLFG